MPAKKSRGAAIIAAMLVVAVVGALAAGMFTQINRWLARTEAARDAAQAQSLASAGVRWAAQYLNEESRLGPLDHLGELWASGLPPTPIEGGLMGGKIVDAQSKFNVNNLAKADKSLSEPDYALARALAASLQIPAAQIDAISAQIRTRPALSLADTPALAAHANLFTALPTRTAINVNTAPQALLQLLAGEKTQQVRDERVARPFQSMADFAARTGTAPQGELSGATNFFEVEVEAAVGTSRAREWALTERGKGVRWQVAM
jgi:general secretion pathway protein K